MPGMALTLAEQQQVRTRVAAFEAATGVQLVTTARSRCDDYPEIPWKAFAAGAAAATLAVVLDLLFPDIGAMRAFAGLVGDWGGTAADMALMMLGAGLVSAGIAITVPAYARVFLSTARAEGEMRQAAQALFLEHELFQTRARTGVLMLVAVFERRVVLLADRGLSAQLPAGALDEAVATMAKPLRAGDWVAAFAAGIDKLEAIAVTRGPAHDGTDNALPDNLDADRGEGDAC